MGKHEVPAAELKDHMADLKRESTKHKRLFRVLRYSVYGLTACLTVLAGVALAVPSLQATISLAIVFTTAAVSIVSAIEGLRKPGELWIHERGLYYDLRDLERDLEYFSADETTPVPVDDLYLRMQSILSSGRDRWRQQVAAGDSQRDKET